MDQQYITKSFSEGTAHLKTFMSYAFPHATEERKKAKKAKKWTVGTWYQGTKQKEIERFGTVGDKAVLSSFLSSAGVSHVHKKRKRKVPGGGQVPGVAEV